MRPSEPEFGGPRRHTLGAMENHMGRLPNGELASTWMACGVPDWNGAFRALAVAFVLKKTLPRFR
jgi:hypothetical protein